MPKIFIVNVGVNASHGNLKSPIFPDNTFRLIPIPEKTEYKKQNLSTYKEIFQPDTLIYIPEKCHNLKVHNDPEFSTFTYGDYPGKPRAANLKNIERGDWLFFLARLECWQDGKFTNEAKFYFIGYFEIEHVLKNYDIGAYWGLHLDLDSPQNNLPFDGIKNNAHILRLTRGKIPLDCFWIFKGNRNSQLFEHAVLFDREFADRVMRDKNGNRWLWDNQKSDLQVIGSYTRTASKIKDEAALEIFKKLVDRKSKPPE
jgi:hypothetical protein